MKERKAGLDIIRTIAILMVMLTHFFGYHMTVVDEGLQSFRWTTFVFLKFLSATGVPFFLLLTGYLQSKRECNKKHYLSIIPVLLSYFVIMGINTVLDVKLFAEAFKSARHIINIFDFEYGYGWYVEMYIGLFLLIPFLNILYRHLTKGQKLCLIGILAALSFVPASIQNITAFGGGIEILPDFFKNLYVLAYYFIGSYIAEYQPKPKKVLCFVVALLMLLAETVLCYLFSETEYAWWLFNNVAGLTHAVVAVSVFLGLYDVSGGIIKYPANWIAKRSFEMYLLSYITDKICYTLLPYSVLLTTIVNVLMVFTGALFIRVMLVPLGRLLTESKENDKKTVSA